MKLASPNFQTPQVTLRTSFLHFPCTTRLYYARLVFGILLSFTLNIRSRLECPPRKPDAFFVLIVSRSPMNYT
ncbi:MAG: hypothetical protein RIG27_19230 [Coleofasciculus sp. F4-SAH-05]